MKNGLTAMTKMITSTTSRTFWAGLVLVCTVGALFAYQYFPQAFPVVSLDLQMDRATALAAARRLAAEHDLGPEEFRQAATFQSDSRVQTFIELEGGGPSVFAEILRDRIFAVYTWRVRHYREGEANETRFQFSPDGALFSVSERLPADAPGVALGAVDARVLAEAEAETGWGIDLDPYALVEQSEERRPSERVDHTLVYERRNASLGDGSYRLRLVVSGDRLTEITPFVQIPEAFSRRYAERRASNQAFGASSRLAMALYLASAVVGLFFLLRQGWVLWRPPVMWGVFVAVLQLLSGLNQWPLFWMRYDTAVPRESFIFQQLGLMLGSTLSMAVLFSLSFLAAETLGRRAFPHHPQLWRLWSRQAGGSRETLGLTVSGFLLVGLFFAYEVGLYFFSRRVLGWWSPSSSLVEPNVMATYAPWFGAIAASLRAGFWEECVFRAIPLAGAVLLGRRVGFPRVWLVSAFVIQAVVFGAGHAPYASIPAYARLAELIIPSFAFGVLYLRFGLLPAVVLHFAYDVVWFALPVFVSSSPGVWVDQILVIALTGVPLWIVLGRRAAGSGRDIPSDLRNAAWTPAAPSPLSSSAPPASPRVLGQTAARVVLAGGGLGLIGSLIATPWTLDTPSLDTPRPQALASAEAALVAHGVSLNLDTSRSWRRLPVARRGWGRAHRFVWAELGTDTFDAWRGSYLDEPHWDVRFAAFDGDVALRAEEWVVRIGANGGVDGVRHRLPESAAGATLSADEARERASQVIETRYQLPRHRLREVSVDGSTREARTDWVVTFADSSVPEPSTGERRIEVSLSGDEVGFVRRFVFVPEDWNRSERRRAAASSVLQGLSVLLTTALLLAGALGAIVSWSRQQFGLRLGIGVFLLLFGVRTITLANGWTSVQVGFSTAQSFQLQALMAATSILLSAGVVSVLLGLTAGGVAIWTPSFARLPLQHGVWLAIAMGTAGSGAIALASHSGTALPDWPQVRFAAAALPWANAALGPVVGYVMQSVLLMLLVVGIERLSVGWTRRRAVTAIALVLVGIALNGVSANQPLTTSLLAGGVTGVAILTAYVGVLRYDPTMAPIIVGVIVGFQQMRHGVAAAYPGSVTGHLLAVVVVAALAASWTRLLRVNNAEDRSAGSLTPST